MKKATMADNEVQQDKEGDQASKVADQRKFLMDVISVLRDNRETLCHLPEMFEQLIEMQEANVAKAIATDTSETFRNEEHKLILAQREKDDLAQRNQYLTNENEVKAKRIQILEKTIEDNKGHILALTDTQKAKMSRDDSITLLQTELQKIKKENTEKDKILLEKEKKFEGLKTFSENVKLRNEDLLRDIDKKEQEVTQQAERMASLERNLQVMVKEKEEKEEKFKQLKELYKTTVHSKDEEIERLKVRVASLSEKRVKQDQSKVEDTLSLNRQSKVEEDFANFFDDARMDAREKIQTFFSLREKFDVDDIYYRRLACLIFEAAYERMKEARRAFFELCKRVTRRCIESAPETSRHFTLHEKAASPWIMVTYTVPVVTQEPQYPTDAVDALMMTLKETALSCKLDCFVEDVIQVVWNKWSIWQSKEKLVAYRLSPSTSLLRDPRIVAYIAASIRLTWRMVTQTPPLQLEYESFYLTSKQRKMGYHSNPEIRTLAKETSSHAQHEEIACYLWPGLLDGEGRCIRAGEVLCKIKDDVERGNSGCFV